MGINISPARSRSHAVMSAATKAFAPLVFALLFCAVPLQSQNRTGAIGGRVITDGGQPLPGGRVYVGSVSDNANGAGRTTSADEQGRFSVPDLESGAYTVTANAPGYVQVRPPAGSQEAADSYYRRPGDSVTLTLRKGGVITGRVVDAQGEPVVGIGVRAHHVRNEEGRVVTSNYFFRLRRTDDLGNYRIYGLEPGAYVVSAGGGGSAFDFTGNFSAYANEAPTYHPSATRDTAAQINVTVGSETTGIDIRYRGEPGRKISGKLAGAIDSTGGGFGDGVSVNLINVADGATEASTYVNPNEERAYSFGGVADGEYELIARRNSRAGTSASSLPRRVAVRGADITGADLTLAPLGSITGALRIEPISAATSESTNGAGACQALGNQPASAPEEIVLIARRQRTDAGKPAHRAAGAAVDDLPAPDGSFALRGLAPGRYRLEVRPPSDHIYIRSITSFAAPAARTAANSGTPKRTNATTPQRETPASDFDLAAGADVRGVRLTLAAGAASVAGRVRSSNDATTLPARLRIYLIPAAPEHADHAWRYRETLVDGDGTWRLRHLAPGAYHILVRRADDNLDELLPRLLTSDAAGRTELRRTTQTSDDKLELTECQRLADYNVRYETAARTIRTAK